MDVGRNPRAFTAEQQDVVGAEGDLGQGNGARRRQQDQPSRGLPGEMGSEGLVGRESGWYFLREIKIWGIGLLFQELCTTIAAPRAVAWATSAA